nr:macrophage immunometabolism regulator isoform X1 [Misgurnus anguillicaudatus]
MSSLTLGADRNQCCGSVELRCALLIISQVMSIKMEMDVSGVSRTPISVLPAAEVKTTLKPEADKPRCSSTPCSPIKNTVSGYQILHINSNYLVGFTTGEELLKLAHKWSSPDTSNTEALPSPVKKPVDLGLHRTSRIYKAKSRYYQPYDIPAINGRRRRRMPSSGESCLKSLIAGEPSKALHGPLPVCLLKGKRMCSKSLDYLNLDKMSLREPADTEVLQYQLQHLTLRGERMFTRNKT